MCAYVRPEISIAFPPKFCECCCATSRLVDILGGKCVCLQGLPGSSTAVKVLSALSEVILMKDWPLAWTVFPVLEGTCVPPAFTFGQLQLKSPPQITTVSRLCISRVLHGKCTCHCM